MLIIKKKLQLFVLKQSWNNFIQGPRGPRGLHGEIGAFGFKVRVGCLFSFLSLFLCILCIYFLGTAWTFWNERTRGRERVKG